MTSSPSWPSGQVLRSTAEPAGGEVSPQARDLFGACEVVDLHVESFVWTRLFGYDLSARHGRGVLRARYYSQADLPRMAQVGLSGAVLSVATNPFRRRARRTTTLLANLSRLQQAVDAGSGEAAVVQDLDGYRRARAAGKLACFVGVQGGNAADSHPGDVERLPPIVSRVTLVHLTRSSLGSASSPWGGGTGLTPPGCDFVAGLNARRILVDLAHASRPTFWDALDVHAPDLPPIVSHTGVCGIHDSWRNVDDGQIRAVADRGGVIGIMYHGGFLGGRTAEAVVRHLEHVVRIGGEDAAALGSDWDGLIVTPRDMPTVLELPVLVQRMLDRGWKEDRVRKVLGTNYLRVLADVRPGPSPGVTPAS